MSADRSAGGAQPQGLRAHPVPARLARAAPGAPAGRAGLRGAVSHPVSALVSGDGVRQRRHQPAVGEQLAHGVGRVLVRGGRGAAGRGGRADSALLARRASGVPRARRRRRRDHGRRHLDLRPDRLADLRQAGDEPARPDAYTSGIEWGIFVALAVAAVLAYAGSQIRLAHEPEPPLPGEGGPAAGGGRRRRRGRMGKGSEDKPSPCAPRGAAYPGPDMGAEDDWTQEVRARRTAPPRPRRLRGAHAAHRARRPLTPQRRPRSAPPHRPQTPRRQPRSACARAHSPRARARPRAGARRRPRPLDRREIQELDIAEPPTATPGPRRLRPRLAGPGEAEAAAPPDHPDPSEAETRRERPRERPADPNDDQLTIRLDRPD